MNNKDFLYSAIDQAEKLGAEHVEVIMSENLSRSVDVRLGKLEHVEMSNSAYFGIRVIIGKKQAIVSSSDFSKSNLLEVCERAVSMAKILPEDKNLLYLPANEIVKSNMDLALYDDTYLTEEQIINIAKEVEESALEVKGISNSNGGSFAHSRYETFVARSGGFERDYRTSDFSCSVSVLAELNGEMESDYAYSSTRYFEDLQNPYKIGKEAANRTIQKLGATKIPSGRMPVIFERRISDRYLRILSAAINGDNVASGYSFLKDKIGTLILPENLNIIDDPHVYRGKRSRVYDGEFLLPQKMLFIENGILNDFLLDLASADKLGRKPNARAARGVSSAPSPAPTNFYLSPSNSSKEDMIASIEYGLYVTDHIGSGANLVTGDYSEGASGFLIRNGKIDHPVSEITIACHLLDLFKRMKPANDLVHEFGVDCPTLLIEEMTVAGK